MGNYRFKFSDMIPNAWFYKLKDLSKQPNKKHPKKKLQPNPNPNPNPNPSISNQTLVNSPPLSSPSSSIKDKQLHHRPSVSLSSHSQSQSQSQRKSYHFTRDINKSVSPVHDDSRPSGSLFEEADGAVQLPRKSSKKRRSTRRSRASPRLANSIVRTGYSCRSSVESVRTNLPDSTSQEYPNSAAETSSETDSNVQPKNIVVAGVTSTETIESATFSPYSWSSRIEDDIVIDLKSTPPARQFIEHLDDKWNPDFDSVSKIELRPVKTKSNKESEPTKTRKQTTKFYDEKSSPQTKRFSISSHSPGLKLRTNTPKIRSRKSVSSNWRRSLSDSFAVVTSSKDPQRDFRESMVEMIVEHNISSSKELEDLLACYLSLNSYKHHDVIITVFKQIWFDFLHAS